MKSPLEQNGIISEKTLLNERTTSQTDNKCDVGLNNILDARKM